MPQAHSLTSCTDGWSRSTMSTALAARSMFSIVQPAIPVFNRTMTPGSYRCSDPAEGCPGRHRIRSPRGRREAARGGTTLSRHSSSVTSGTGSGAVGSATRTRWAWWTRPSKAILRSGPRQLSPIPSTIPFTVSMTTRSGAAGRRIHQVDASLQQCTVLARGGRHLDAGPTDELPVFAVVELPQDLNPPASKIGIPGSGCLLAR